MKFLPSGHPFGILWKLKTNKTLNRLDDIPSGHPFGILWKFVCLFILLFLSYNILYSQNNEFTKENFEGNKDELKKALSFIKEGDKLIAGNNIRFRESLANYLEADKINSNSALLNYKIGKCYLNITLEKYKSISYLEKAYKLNPTCQDDILYLLAQAYQLNYEFDKAITNYLAYMRTTPPGSSDKLINKKIDECKTAKELIKRPVDVYIENLGPVINGKFPDYSPIISADESMLIFTSRRDNTVGGKIADFDDKYYEDIYITYWQQDSGRWTTPFNPKPPVNTELHDATVGLSPDGKRILIYKTNREGDIFESVIDSNQNFTKPKALNNNINTNFHESVATFSPDGKTIYFCSARDENSYGGHDIFFSKLDKKGDWGPAYNIGKTINTPFDEESVFLMGDGKTLYFSSNGHNTMGGFDIFKTTLQNGEWTTPVNIGHPINTPDDDVHFSISANGLHGYYSSAKNTGYGDLDIYRITFLGVDKTLYCNFEEMLLTSYHLLYTSSNKTLRTKKGHIYDAQTKEPVNAEITFLDNTTNKILDNIKTDDVPGEYRTELPPDLEYLLTVKSPGYITHSEIIPKDKPLNKDIYLIKSDGIDQPRQGFVFDIETKKPICNAEVLITDNKTIKLLEKHKTDCNTGLYSSRLPKDKDYLLDVKAPGYLPFNELIPLGVDVNKVIYLIKKQDRPGTVFDDATKEPICDALVSISDVKAANQVDKLNSDCPSGNYLSKLPLNKQYKINVEAPGYLPYIEYLDAGQNVNKNIYLKKTGSLPVSGNVYDEDTKEPVSADVIIINTKTRKKTETLKTNPLNGEYKATSPLGESYTINVNSPGYEPYTENLPPDLNVNKIIYIHKIKPAILSGFVLDADTKIPVASKIIIRINKTKIKVDSLNTDSITGSYSTALPKGEQYYLTVNAPLYIPYFETITAKDEINKTILIKKEKAIAQKGKIYDLSLQKTYVLPNILYDFDKFDLKPQSKDSLNDLIKTMFAYPNIVIELGSHTDIRGTDEYNERLSYNRAKAVVDYLITKGIAAERFVAKGYGEKVPRTLDRDMKYTSCGKSYFFAKGTQLNEQYILSLPGGKCEQEAAHQLNRRTEFKILRDDFNPDALKKTSSPVQIEVIKK